MNVCLFTLLAFWRNYTVSRPAQIIKNMRQTPLALPYKLKLNVTALRRHAPLQPPETALDKRRVLRQPGLRHTLPKLPKHRDRHGQARPIICVPFWAITSSLCVSISFFGLSFSLPFTGTDLPKYISARIKLMVPILVAQKKGSKMDTAFLYFWVSSLSLSYFLFQPFFNTIQIKQEQTLFKDLRH